LEIVSLLEKFSTPGGEDSDSRSMISRPLTPASELIVGFMLSSK
jgi:hypothetical protein